MGKGAREDILTRKGSVGGSPMGIGRRKAVLGLTEETTASYG